MGYENEKKETRKQTIHKIIYNDQQPINGQVLVDEFEYSMLDT